MRTNKTDSLQIQRLKKVVFAAAGIAVFFGFFVFALPAIQNYDSKDENISDSTQPSASEIVGGWEESSSEVSVAFVNNQINQTTTLPNQIITTQSDNNKTTQETHSKTTTQRANIFDWLAEHEEETSKRTTSATTKATTTKTHTTKTVTTKAVTTVKPTTTKKVIEPATTAASTLKIEDFNAVAVIGDDGVCRMFFTGRVVSNYKISTYVIEIHEAGCTLELEERCRNAYKSITLPENNSVIIKNAQKGDVIHVTITATDVHGNVDCDEATVTVE